MTAPLPPRWLRRAALHPLFFALGCCVLVGTMPLALLSVVLVVLGLPGPVRAARLLAFGFVYLGLELLVMVLAFGAWLVSGLGWALHRPAFVSFHYGLVAAALEVLVRVGSRSFALDVDVKVSTPAPGQGPLLVLSRHAGPGDSLLLMHHLITRARRRPRIVVKHTLQWDPMIDLVFNRLPMVFVDPVCARPGLASARIAHLATTMGPRDALLIFPEGRNVTPHRRRCAIDRLRRAGREQATRRAESIRHLMLPRPRGVHAALSARPDLAVVVVAHTGLDDLSTVSAMWQAVPMDKTLVLRWHGFAAEAVPKDLSGVSDWVFAQWQQMDGWVAAHRVVRRAGAPVDPAALIA